jgi:hypothetical protein
MLYDIYLTGPQEGVSSETLIDGLSRIFGSIPGELVEGLQHRPVRVKSSVDLATAQRFVAALKQAGGSVQLIQAGQALELGGGPLSAGMATSAIKGAGSYGRGRHRISLPQPVAETTGVASHPASAAAPTFAEPVRADLEPIPATVEGLRAPLSLLFIKTESIAVDHALRAPEHQLKMPALRDLDQPAENLHPALALAVWRQSAIDGELREQLSQRFQLDDTIRLYLSDQSQNASSGVILSDRYLAWREARIPYRRIRSVALQCDVSDQPYVQVWSGEEEFDLPRVGALATMVLAESLGSVCSTRQLWIGPRAAGQIWHGLVDLQERLKQQSKGRPQTADLARRALGKVDRYLELIEERMHHWRRYVLGKHNSAIAVPAKQRLDLVGALDVIETAHLIAPSRLMMLNELLGWPQAVLAHEEQILAIFEFRPPRCCLPGEASGWASGAYVQQRDGWQGDPDWIDQGMQETFLLRSLGVLTPDRLFWIRRNQQVALAVDLDSVIDVEVSMRQHPQLSLRYHGPFGDRTTLRYNSSGNYLYPRPGDARQQVEALAEAIRRAKFRREMRGRRASGLVELPPYPPWLDQVLASEQDVLRRFESAVQMLLRQSASEIIAAAQCGARINLLQVKPMRQRLLDIGVDLGGLGHRILFLPAELFEGPGDGLMVTVGALLISGTTCGKADWNEIERIDLKMDGRWTEMTVVTRRGELSIRCKDPHLVTFIGSLISTAVRTAAVL